MITSGTAATAATRRASSYLVGTSLIMAFPMCAISASRRVEAPSRHRRDSSLGEEVVGGFFFEFEAVRTASRDRDAPRRCMNSTKCPFHPDNSCTNDNFVCHIFGNVGFPYFDKRRKLWMGLAMWSTLFAMFVTAAGALSLSTDKDIVRSTYWVYVEATNSTERTRYFLGLRSIVYVQGGDVRSERLDTDLILSLIHI